MHVSEEISLFSDRAEPEAGGDLSRIFPEHIHTLRTHSEDACIHTETSIEWEAHVCGRTCSQLEHIYAATVSRLDHGAMHLRYGDGR